MKSVMWYISALLLAISVKPWLHYLSAEFGWWGWGTGVLMYIAAIAVWAWIRIKMDRTDGSKRSG
jgi:hypothetical protein